MTLPRLHRAGLLLVLATAVVLVTVLTLLAGHRDRPEGEPPEPAVTPGPSASPTVEPATTPSARAQLRALPRGEPPRIPYLHGSWYVDARGALTRLRTPHGAHAVVPWNDGFLVADTRWFEGTNGLTHVSRGGRVLGSWPTSGAPVAAPDGRVAWTQVTMPEASNPRPTVLFVGYPDGRVEHQRLRPGLASVVGFAGRYVVFRHTFLRGYFVTDLRLPPQRLPRRLVERRPKLPSLPPFEVLQQVREDARNALVVVRAGSRTAVLRLTRRDRLERVTPIRRIRDFLDLPYVLATRP